MQQGPPSRSVVVLGGASAPFLGVAHKVPVSVSCSRSSCSVSSTCTPTSHIQSHFELPSSSSLLKNNHQDAFQARPLYRIRSAQEAGRGKHLTSKPYYLTDPLHLQSPEDTFPIAPVPIAAVFDEARLASIAASIKGLIDIQWGIPGCGKPDSTIAMVVSDSGAMPIKERGQRSTSEAPSTSTTVPTAPSSASPPSSMSKASDQPTRAVGPAKGEEKEFTPSHVQPSVEGVEDSGA